MTPQPKCPECEKLTAVSDKSQIIGEFLDYFLPSKGIVFAEWYENEEGEEELITVHIPIEKLLAEYFEIDMEKVEQERRALLEWIRSV